MINLYAIRDTPKLPSPCNTQAWSQYVKLQKEWETKMLKIELGK